MTLEAEDNNVTKQLKRRATIKRASVILTAVMLSASACSGGSDGGEAQDGDAAPAETVTTEVNEVDDAFAAMEAELDELSESVDDLATDEPDPTTPPDTTETTAPQETTPSTTAPSGGGAISGAIAVFTLSDIQDVTAGMLGPTDDVTAVANELAPFPAVPTMPGTAVHGLLFEIRKGELQTTHSNRIGVWSLASFDDTLGFYETELASLGYPVDDLTTSQSGDDQAAAFRFALPDEGDLTVRQMTVTIRTGRSGVGSEVEFWSRSQEPPGEQLSRYNLWAANAPIPDGGTQDVVNVSVQLVGPLEAPREYWASSSVSWDFPSSSEQEIRGQVGELLGESATYTLEGDLSTFAVRLGSTLFPDKGAQMQIMDSGSDASLTLIGSWDIPA